MMKLILRLLLLLFWATGFALRAQAPFYNPVISPTSTNHAVWQTTSAAAGSLNFVLFGDGTFASSIVGPAGSVSIPHNYPTPPTSSSTTYTSRAFIIPPYTPDPPTERTNMVVTGPGISTTTTVPFGMGTSTIALSNSWFPSPGNWSFTILSFRNTCSATQINGTLTYYYNDNEQTFTTSANDVIIYNNWASAPTIVTPSGNPNYTHKLVLNYSGLAPNQVRHVYIKSKLHNWVNVGQVVPARFEMKTNCSNNNTFATDGAIQAKGSPHDPNGKSVNKKIVCAGNAVPHSLVYTIHFQNVGSAPAHDVVIEDILPPELDPSTVQVLSSSASYTLPNVPPPLLKISFPGIDLPGAAQPGVTFNQTIGTISFRVNTVNCLLPGQIIPNMATIEFLGQPSIQTGVAYTIVDENFCHEVCADEPHHLPGDRTGTLDIFEIKPNPVTDALWIQISPKHNWELSIYDTQGRSYYSSAGAANQDETVNLQVQTNDWPSGVYFVKWADAAQHPVRKVIKL